MFNIEKLKIIGENILHLISGTVATQILGFLFNIFIARRLGASEYGIFNTVSAFAGMFAFLTFQGYQKVIIRECSGNKEKIEKTIENVLGIKIALSLFAVIVTVISSFFFNYSRLITIFISIFSFTLLFNSIGSIFHVVYHVNFKMKYIVYINLIQKFIYMIPSGVCIWLKGGVEHLIIFFTVSTFFNMLLNLYIVNKVFSVSLNFKNIVKNNFNPTFFKEAFVFSLLGFIGYFYNKIDILMLSLMVSAESVGIYSAVFKLIAPMEMAGKIVKVAFFPQFIESFKEAKKIKVQVLIKMSLLIAVCLVPVSIFITFFSDKIILYTFGTEYSDSAQVLKYLCWMIPLGTVTIPFILSMQANHHEKKLILPNILRAASNVVLNYIFIKKFGYMGAVYSTVLTYFWYYIIVNFGYQYYVLKKTGNII